ncbi:MAG: T9SS type A sorting domain-containing protein [Candidatus Eisenbacteria sp.]|nr:T9SS type A sorting domain-containing protein [Candidatus Eisenbacteria bacterium]
MRILALLTCSVTLLIWATAPSAGKHITQGEILLSDDSGEGTLSSPSMTDLVSLPLLSESTCGDAPFRVEVDEEGWSLWQGGELRWRASNPTSDTCEHLCVVGDDYTLEQIASWTCPGNNSTGGQFHSWDLNANGRPDLCYSNWRYTTYVYEGVGDNQFEEMHQYPNPVGSYYTKLVCAGDGDSDGLAELVYSSGTSGVPRDIFFVEPRQLGAYPDSVVLALPEGNIGVSHMRMADLDGDGLREYIGTTQGTHNKLVSIWECRGDNSYTQVFAEHYGPGSAVSGEPAVGDFDGDGNGDLVVLQNGGGTIVHVIESVGDDLYEEAWSASVPTGNMYWVTPGPDLDRDGRGDFVVTGGIGSSPVTWSFIMYESTGDNTYELVWSYSTSSTIIHGGAATGDIDGDGWPELLCQVPDHTYVFRAAGDNNLELCWELAGSVMGQGEHRIVAPDLDEDGKGEAIWWTANNPGVLVVYEKTGPPLAAIDGEAMLRPSSCTLYQGCPNPFHATTVIGYGLAGSCHVNLAIYNMLGRKIATLVNERQRGGNKSLAWDASRHPSGIYFCRLQAGSSVDTKRMVLLNSR